VTTYNDSTHIRHTCFFMCHLSIIIIITRVLLIQGSVIVNEVLHMNSDHFSLYHTRHSNNTCGKYLLMREILLQERRENSICYYIHGLIKKIISGNIRVRGSSLRTRFERLMSNSNYSFFLPMKLGRLIKTCLNITYIEVLFRMVFKKTFCYWKCIHYKSSKFTAI